MTNLSNLLKSYNDAKYWAKTNKKEKDGFYGLLNDPRVDYSMVAEHILSGFKKYCKKNNIECSMGKN
jgi:hypothetical protein